MKITRKTKLTEILEENPKAGKILANYGFHCLGCQLASYETLEQAASVHGLNKGELDKLIKELNKKQKS